jgi:3-phenylpropionate/cinnamic acid dioxygenase small subunit
MTVHVDPIESRAFANQLSGGSEIHHQVVSFLNREAWLLDHDQWHEWTETFAEDLTYRAPIRVTRSRRDKRGQTSYQNYHYLDDFDSMKTRVRRLLDTNSAWSDDPPARYRRFISNVIVCSTDQPNEFDVTSYLMLARSRFEWSEYKWVTAERNDCLRLVNGVFKLARREIIVDQAVLGTPGLAIFL